MLRRHHTYAKLAGDEVDDYRFAERIIETRLIPAVEPTVGGWFIEVRSHGARALLNQTNLPLDRAKRLCEELIGKLAVFMEFVDYEYEAPTT